VLCLGIGLTDLNKTEFGQDAALSPDGWDVAGFLERIDQVRPRRVAFTSKTAGAVCFGVPTSALRCGVQERDVAGIETWVLPSPSGQARSHWSEEPWMDLGRAVAMSRLGNDRRDALEDAGGG
jgi:TDG/mug DNA glycosylase family protein